MHKTEGTFCQSCGMPLEDKKDYGTDANGRPSDKYCRFCYKKGKFTEPDMTMRQMIDKVVSIMKLGGIPEEQVREMAENFIPTLERWRDKLN